MLNLPEKTFWIISMMLISLNLFPDTKALKKAEGTESRWAVCIGINDYWDKKITDLEKARNDAKALGQSLTDYGSFNKIFVMTDDIDPKKDLYPTKFNIEEKIRYIADMANPNDLVIFHFSGHGITNNNDSFLISADTRMDSPSETAVNLNNVVKILNSAGIKKVLYLVDACREEVSKSKGLGNSGINNVIYETAEVAATFFSTKSGWYSYEDPDSDNGIFTRFVVNGISGLADMNGDLMITFSELEQYVTSAIYEYAVSIDLKQKPYTKIYGEKYGDLLITRIKQLNTKNTELNHSLSKNTIENNIQQINNSSMIFVKGGSVLNKYSNYYDTDTVISDLWVGKYEVMEMSILVQSQNTPFY